MINKQIITNKSNLRIASDSNSITVFPTNSNNNNNHHNNIVSLHNLNLIPGTLPSSLTTTQTSHNTSKFAISQSSPSLEDTSHTISIAFLNVRGFASSVSKFDAIIDNLFNKDLSIIGLQKRIL